MNAFNPFLILFFCFTVSYLPPQFLIKGENESEKIKDETDVWIPDNGDGTYKNPIIYADYSDPDVCRAGDDYFLTSSSFSNFPGLPILHSKDLVNWKIIGHAAVNYPFEEFSLPQHGNGIWAPSIRYHNNEFYIYFGDPDRGIFMTKAKNPAGPWQPLKLIRKAVGWIDACPFWDDDGNAYLVHAWAKSRSGFKDRITINKMSFDGEKILDDGVTVFWDSLKHPTIEGPKLYKRNGYYYIFAPAGGVKPGWQVVLRSKSIYGPYDDKIVLEQGSTKVNGPHQGAWIQTQTGEDWFIHFQDRYSYGRIVHLQPMKWENDWPIVGLDYDKNGIGEPVQNYKKPDVGKVFPIETPQTEDEFNSAGLGLQWQWQANFKPERISLEARKGWLRLYSQSPANNFRNLWNAPYLLMQKIPAPAFSAAVKLELSAKNAGEKSGLIVFGTDYSYLGIEKTLDGYKISQIECKNANSGGEETVIQDTLVTAPFVHLRADVEQENEIDIIPKVTCVFSYSLDGETYHQLGKKFIVKAGKWVGAKIGVFAAAPNGNLNNGYADFDWVRFNP